MFYRDVRLPEPAEPGNHRHRTERYERALQEQDVLDLDRAHIDQQRRESLARERFHRAKTATGYHLPSFRRIRHDDRLSPRRRRSGTSPARTAST
jgi:hypothetical protein